MSQEMMIIFDSIANSWMVCLACGGSLASSSQHLYLISFTSTEQSSSLPVNACMARSFVTAVANSIASETDYSLRA